MVEQYEWPSDDTSEQSDWSVNAVTTELEVLETAHLECLQLCIIGRKQRVEGLREDVDDRSKTFSAPVKPAHLLQHELRVV